VCYLREFACLRIVKFLFCGKLELMIGSFRKFGKLSFRGIGWINRDVVFFVSFYLYMWLVVDSRLIYYGNGVVIDCPVFFRGWTFFRETVFRPGGLVVYISGFLSEFLYYSWTGALVVTALAWGLYITTKALIDKTGARRFIGLGYVSPILMLILYSRYTHFIVVILALLLALIFTYFYLNFRPAGKLKSIIIFLFMSVVLYTAAAAAYFVFAALCVIYEVLFGRRWWLGLLYLLLAVVIVYVEGVLFFGVSIIESFSDLLPFSWKVITKHTPHWEGMAEVLCILCFFVPAVVFLLGILRVPILSGLKKETFFTGSSGTSVSKWFLMTIFLFSLAGGAVFYSYDSRLRSLFAVDYYAYHSKWDKLLKASRSCPNDFFVMHAVNRALYHTGRLATDMFAYPQHPGALFFPEETKDLLLKCKRFDVHIDLGALNLAEIDLTQCLDINGQRPMILQYLALIKMVKGDLNSARVYLNALSRTLFFSDWAKRYLAELESNPELLGDEQIQNLRRVMPKKDQGFRSYDNDKMLMDLLETNKHNRMAFEYLMGWYLLNGRVDKIALNIGRLNDFNYKQIPRLYEEALLVYKSDSKQEVDLHGWKISAESVKRYNDFIDIYTRYAGGEHEVYNELLEDYGDSFLFYFFCRRPETEEK
jgi:hypothetical protein